MQSPVGFPTNYFPKNLQCCPSFVQRVTAEVVQMKKKSLRWKTGSMNACLRLLQPYSDFDFGNMFGGGFRFFSTTKRVLDSKQPKVWKKCNGGWGVIIIITVRNDWLYVLDWPLWHQITLIAEHWSMSKGQIVQGLNDKVFHTTLWSRELHFLMLN